MYNNDDLIAPALDDVRKNYDGKVIIGQDLMVVDIGDEILVRKAVVDDKPWPVAPAGVKIGEN
jgi:selenocysteine-specific translation elongation factor